MDTDITVEALECLENGKTQTGKLIIHKDTLRRLSDKGHNNIYAQFDRLVSRAMLNPEFIFLGLERPLFNDDKLDGDHEKLIYVFSPRFDYIWEGHKSDGGIARVAKPKNCIFTVIVSKNKRHQGQYNDIFGFIEEWCWCGRESQGKKPVGWIDRYGRIIFEKDKLTLI